MRKNKQSDNNVTRQSKQRDFEYYMHPETNRNGLFNMTEDDIVYTDGYFSLEEDFYD